MKMSTVYTIFGLRVFLWKNEYIVFPSLIDLFVPKRPIQLRSILLKIVACIYIYCSVLTIRSDYEDDITMNGIRGVYILYYNILVYRNMYIIHRYTLHIILFIYICYKIRAVGDAILFPVTTVGGRSSLPDAVIGSISFGRFAQQGCDLRAPAQLHRDHRVRLCTK